MSDVRVPYGDDQGETATLLLAAAEELGLDASVVSIASLKGEFIAPKEVAKKAKVDFTSDESEDSEDEDEAEENKPAKKAAAKKAASSK